MGRLVELPESKRWVNPDHIKEFDPERSNRIDYINGTHQQISQEDANALLLILGEPQNTRVAQLAEARKKRSSAKANAPKKQTKKPTTKTTS